MESIGSAVKRVGGKAFGSAGLHNGKSDVLKLGIHLKKRKSIRSDLAITLGRRNKSGAKLVVKAGGMLVVGREENMVDFAAKRRRIANGIGTIIANGMLHSVKAFSSKIGNVRNDILVSTVVQKRIAIVGSVSFINRPIFENLFIKLVFGDVCITQLTISQKEGGEIGDSIVAAQVRIINKIRKNGSKRA